MPIQDAIQLISKRQDLSEFQMREVMQTIMRGEATPAQIGGFLMGMHMKGETITEVATAVQVMRTLSVKVAVNVHPLIDTCGTGGDGANTFNVSTVSSLVASAAGAWVAKHGNRSISSRCGSADVLEAAGVNLASTPAQLARCIEKAGIGFMFAPAYHKAMKHVVHPRRELGIRGFFNILGPLINPAGASNQLIGVFSADWLIPMVKILKNLGSQHVLLVHANDGLDEISIASPTRVVELVAGEIKDYEIAPGDFGMAYQALDTIAAYTVEESLSRLRSVLNNEAGPARDIVCLNAGAAIYTAGLTDTLAQGVILADEAICSGAAKEKLVRLVELSNAV